MILLLLFIININIRVTFQDDDSINPINTIFNNFNCEDADADFPLGPQVEHSNSKEMLKIGRITAKFYTFPDKYKECGSYYAIVALENANITESLVMNMIYSGYWNPEHAYVIHLGKGNENGNEYIRKVIGDGRSEDNPKLKEKYTYRLGIAARLHVRERVVRFKMNEDTISVGERGSSSGLEVALIVVLAILLIITFTLLGILLYVNYSGDSRWQNLFIFWSKDHTLIEHEGGLRKGYRNNDFSSRCSTISIGSFHEGNFEIRSNPININELSDYVLAMIENGKIKQEFASVMRGQVMRWDYSKQAEHKSKNRYGNLLPYDHSRVVLDSTNEQSSDYINANFIDGYKSPNRYIATQGPLNNTIGDFWRMIWQKNCHQIVMLTNLDEGGKNKCDKYWPENSESYDGINVSLEKTEIFADYAIRTFLVKKDENVREIIQYHFLSWPDHTVPMYACSLLTFMGKMRSSVHYKASEPITVHCSAGVGRTGTFIVIDTMLEMSKHEKQIDILAHLCTIRLQRINLVEKLPQYEFIHHALVEALSHDPTSIDCNQFHSYWLKLNFMDNATMTTPIQQQFQLLNKLSPQTLNKELCYNGSSNSAKNRNNDIIPPDYARVILPNHSADDYINAVYINGYKRRDAFIVTQIPMENTKAHFWQMVSSTGAKTIVLLNDTKTNDETYWPTYSNKTINFSDSLVVNLVSEDHHGCVNIRTFQINNDVIVKQFHLKGWSQLANKPMTKQMLIELLEKVEQWQLQCAHPNLIVQCLDGNRACGVYCSASFICDRIKEEHEVDVFLAVQTVRTNRPQFIVDLDQYKFLYETSACYLEHFDTYSNFK